MPHAVASTLATLVLAVAASVASAGKPDPRWSGTYSNLCMHEESGDLLGIEMSFVHASGASAQLVLFQFAEGVLPEPRLIRLAPTDEGRLGFAGAAGTPPFVVQPGADETVRITFPQASTPTGPATQTLVRRDPAWSGKQRVPACR